MRFCHRTIGFFADKIVLMTISRDLWQVGYTSPELIRQVDVAVCRQLPLLAANPTSTSSKSMLGFPFYAR